MTNIIVIVNPKAGRVGKMNRASMVSDFLEKNSIPFQMIETKFQRHATEIASEFYSQGHRHFICLGGDGTLFETVNGFYDQRLRIEPVYVGVIPTGTGNSFLKDFSDSTKQTLTSIIEKKSKPCDVVEVTHKKGKLYFVNIFSFGFTADVGKLRNDCFSFAGSAGYILAVLGKVLNLTVRSYKLTLDQNKKIDGNSTFISINNTRYTGGNMMMAPDASPNDGRVDVIDVKQMSRMNLLKAFPMIFNGTHTKLKEIISSKAREIQFEFDHEIPIMIDGELIEIQPLSLRVLPQGIQIYA